MYFPLTPLIPIKFNEKNTFWAFSPTPCRSHLQNVLCQHRSNDPKRWMQSRSCTDGRISCRPLGPYLFSIGFYAVYKRLKWWCCWVWVRVEYITMKRKLCRRVESHKTCVTLRSVYMMAQKSEVTVCWHLRNQFARNQFARSVN